MCIGEDGASEMFLDNKEMQKVIIDSTNLLNSSNLRANCKALNDIESLNRNLLYALHAERMKYIKN